MQEKGQILPNQKKRIFVVDDEPDVVFTLRKVLESCSFEDSGSGIDPEILLVIF
jgi:CheY-like chemotaxis protein